MVPGLYGAAGHQIKSVPPFCDNFSPGEHHFASQNADALLGTLCPPVPICICHGRGLHLPQAADGTDTSSTQSWNFLHLCVSLSYPISLSCFAASMIDSLSSSEHS